MSGRQEVGRERLITNFTASVIHNTLLATATERAESQPSKLTVPNAARRIGT